MLEGIERDTFAYFLGHTVPANGPVADRADPSEPAGITDMVFALAVHPVGLELRVWSCAEVVAMTAYGTES